MRSLEGEENFLFGKFSWIRMEDLSALLLLNVFWESLDSGKIRFWYYLVWKGFLCFRWIWCWLVDLLVIVYVKAPEHGESDVKTPEHSKSSVNAPEILQPSVKTPELLMYGVNTTEFFWI